jgi:glycosyltransferase involved in cell wall biosynthesis
LARREIVNRRAFSRVAREFKPDIVYFWNMGSLSISLAFQAQDFGMKCCYFVSDGWLSNWEGDPWFLLTRGSSRSRAKRLGQAVLRPAFRILGMTPLGDLNLKHVHFASLYLKQAAIAAGKPVADAEVIRWGVDASRFRYQSLPNAPKRILFVGQVVAHKGVRTLIEAMNVIVNKDARREVCLTVVGGSLTPSYVTELRMLTESYGLQHHVEFAGSIQRELLPSVYHEHDILVLPSVWDEPFSISLLEALASGLAVVATATGGTGEILRDGFNALIFPKGDVQACAAHILRLLDDPELFQRIRSNGRRTVEADYCLGKMVDLLEQSLTRIIAGDRFTLPGPDSRAKGMNRK